MALNEMTDARYIGKICAHHPEFNGLRAKRSYQCVQCWSEDRRHIPRGTLSAVTGLDSKIRALQKEWDTHNLAMRDITKQLEALTLERDEKEADRNAVL